MKVIFTKSSKIRISIALSVMLFLMLPLLLVIFIRSTSDPILSSKAPKTDFQFLLSLDRVDVPQSIARASLMPRFTGEIGEPTKNGSLALRDIEVLVDSFQGNNSFKAEVGQLLGRQEYDVVLVGNTWRYPFDSYKASFSITSSGLVDYPLSVIEKRESIPGFNVHSSTFPNYISTSYPKKATNSQMVSQDLKQGVLNINWEVNRQSGDIYAALLLAVLMILSVLASFYVTRAVWLGRRPPSIATLAWLAAFLFAMFQIRNSLPGNPPNGNLYDLFVFYPILIVLLVEMAMVVYLWIDRDDWDMKNANYIKD
jgi:hypothetical protein